MDLFTVKAPLIITFDNGDSEIMAERFPHPEGIIYVPPFWFQPEQEPRIVRGKIEGGGPWKIAGAVIRLLSCRDRNLKLEWSDWEQAAGNRTADPGYAQELNRIMRMNGALL